MTLLSSLKALWSYLALSIESNFSTFRARRAISSAVALGAIIAIIVGGGIIIFYLVVTPSGPTISPYP